MPGGSWGAVNRQAEACPQGTHILRRGQGRSPHGCGADPAGAGTVRAPTAAPGVLGAAMEALDGLSVRLSVCREGMSDTPTGKSASYGEARGPAGPSERTPLALAGAAPDLQPERPPRTNRA